MKIRYLLIGTLFTFFSTLVSAQSATKYGQLSVDGIYLTDSAQNPVVLRGMSFGWHNWWPRFYNENVVNWLADDWKVDIVRAAMGVDVDGGYINDSATAVNAVKAVVDAAIAKGIYVIIDWHCHNTLTDKAKAFFKLMAQTYGNYSNVLYEIYNEPDGDKTWSEVKTYAIEVIDSIRAYDSDNIILVGSPNWDQDIDDVADDPISSVSNIMYTVHFYAATHGESLRDKCDYAIGKNIPIFVSESSGCESDGAGDVDAEEWNNWITWMETNKISWLCWMIADKDETCSALESSASSNGGWAVSDLNDIGVTYRNLFRKYAYNYEPARIWSAMAKARRGEDIIVGTIGGSITQGYAASSEDKRWANLMADWWETKFPDINVTLVNAGWGGTGSDIGVHRLSDDLLSKNPDFVMVEFAVNDTKGDLATKMMEGIAQQVLTADSTPGVMFLYMKQSNGTTAQESHKIVSDYYGIPIAPFADVIDSLVNRDGVSLSSIFDDGLHPNDVGMAYIAEVIYSELDSIYATLPDNDEDIPEANTLLPDPIVTDVYSSTFQYNNENIVPTENTGWEESSEGWTTSEAGNEVQFKVMGNSVSIIYTQTNDNNRGEMQVWVDGGDTTTINCWFNETWGTKYAYALIQEGLADGEHMVHAKVIEASSTGGNSVMLYRIMTAGNIGSAAPIANTSAKQKMVLGTSLGVYADGCYDPDGESISAYLWAIEDGPSGNAATLTNATDSLATFTPDIAGEYTLSLTVTAGVNTSVPAYKTVEVKATNIAPVAVIGNDTTVATKKYIYLSGADSYDADGDALTYAWTLETKPDGSSASISFDDKVTMQTKLDVEGVYSFGLVVSDSIAYSNKVIITITAKAGYTSFEEQESKNEFDVYPNPSSGIVHLNFNLTDNAVLSIYSITGSKVSSINIKSGKSLTDLNLYDYVPARGIYFLKVVSPSVQEVKKITLF